MGKCYANKVIEIALAEVGYLEKKTNSNLDSKTANAGYNNYTKYARDFDEKYPNFYNGKKHRGCTKYITIPEDLRLAVDRDSKYFKSNYSLRTECERYNSRFKNTGQERMWVRNKASVTNLNTLAHISLLAVAVAAITTNTGKSYRKLKSSKRIA